MTSSNGIIYILCFGGGGGILLYVFLISPTIAMRNRVFLDKIYQFAGDHLDQIPTGVEHLHKIPESVIGANDEVERLTAGGNITTFTVRKFIREYLDVALQYAFRRQIDGTQLNRDTMNLYRQWENKGLNKEMILTEISKMLNSTVNTDSTNLAKIKNDIIEVIENENKIRTDFAPSGLGG